MPASGAVRFRITVAVHRSERNHTVQFHGSGIATHVKFPSDISIGQDTSRGKMHRIRQGISIIARGEPIAIRGIATARSFLFESRYLREE